ncbi:Basic-leucine zipper (bZIP) transcription factor family protein [Euphorbia peplus]|nr:Basic-leucine zipper (bZIP) transcription factor family protein [Euphorbia peplus]
MAQLPPKIPNMQPTWPEFTHHKLPSMNNIPNIMMSPPLNATAASSAAATQNPSWVDEFLDFSSARRGTHRRSMSDSIAFLEAPTMLDERLGGSGGGAVSGAPHHGSGHNSSTTSTTHDFDKFDDEQFLSMFTDDISNAVAAPSCSNTSTPSDHNSFNDDKETGDQKFLEKKMRHHESDEVESNCETDTQTQSGATGTSSGDRISDPKRVKRILANRQSAQRSRVRKLQYISELERSVTSLQAEVSVLSPRVAFLDHQRLLLNVDNSALKQRIAALAQDKIFKDAHQEALKREIERLRQVYHQQKMENSANDPPEKEQQLLQV